MGRGNWKNLRKMLERRHMEKIELEDVERYNSEVQGLPQQNTKTILYIDYCPIFLTAKKNFWRLQRILFCDAREIDNVNVLRLAKCFSYKKNPIFKLQHQTLEVVNNFKMLSLPLDSPQWVDHLNFVVSKLNKYFVILETKQRLNTYFAFTFSLFSVSLFFILSWTSIYFFVKHPYILT